MPVSVATELKRELEQYMSKDRYGQEGQYTISSLYYDSQDFRFYWEKIEGIKYRRKLRIRRYVDEGVFDDDSLVYVEIKQRVDRVTQKRRVTMTYRQALDLCNEGIVPPHAEEDAAVIQEIESMVRLYALEPQSITTYQREAFVGADCDIGLRITFDTGIAYSRDDLDLAHHHRDDLMISPDMTIMEIKTNERIPYWVTELVARYNLRLIRVSKYCQSLEAAQVVPPSMYHIS